MGRTSVLVVEPDRVRRDEIAGWLETEGLDVLMCGGPEGPEYNCLGGRGEDCPLAEVSDTVVLDMQLESDMVMCGAPGWMLLLYYFDRGKQIVALSGPEDSVHALDDEQVTVIPRTADRATLVRAVAHTLNANGGRDGEHLAR